MPDGERQPFREDRRLNVPFAAEVKKHVRIPVAVVGNITSLAEAEEIIASGNANVYGTSMHCAVNPHMGETEPIPKAPVKKRVMVIGGGPAGMTAAQVLRARGHEVDLYEKTDRLGGLLDDATIAPFKEYMRLYLDWHKKETIRCGLKYLERRSRVRIKTL